LAMYHRVNKNYLPLLLAFERVTTGVAGGVLTAAEVRVGLGTTTSCLSQVIFN